MSAGQTALVTGAAALHRGGKLVSYGFMGATTALSTALMFANLFLGSRLRGRRGTF